jgi:hypothetical protein
MEKIHTSSPDDIFEDSILVPWDSDLEYFLDLYKKGDDGDNERLNISSHSFVFEIYQSQFDLKDPTRQPIISWEGSDWEKRQPDQDGFQYRIYRMIKWEELDSMAPVIDHYWRLIGTDANGSRYYAGQGVFNKGRRN